MTTRRNFNFETHQSAIGQTVVHSCRIASAQLTWAQKDIGNTVEDCHERAH